MQEALLSMATIAIVEVYKLCIKKQWESVAKIVTAASVGTIAGAFGIGGMDVLTGLAAGLAASGVHTAVGQLRVTK